MRKRILRRLEALEEDHRSREQKELSSLEEARTYIWIILLAYHSGDLGSDETGTVRRKRESAEVSISGRLNIEVFLRQKRHSRFHRRHDDACRRFFAKVGLDFDRTPPSVLFDAFITMVNQLPDQWLNWLRSHSREYCSDPEIAAGSNLPRGLTPDNFLFG